MEKYMVTIGGSFRAMMEIEANDSEEAEQIGIENVIEGVHLQIKDIDSYQI